MMQRTHTLTISDPLEKHAKYIFEDTYLQPFSQNGIKRMKDNLHALPVERISHGAQHACRVAAFVRIFVNFYRAMGKLEACQFSEEDIQLLQIAGLCHDAMRQNDGIDYWENESAAYCENYLLSIGVLPAKAKLFAKSIVDRNSNLLGRILQSADCLDITRCISLFYINRLSAYQDASADFRCELLSLLKEVMALQAKQHDVKCHVTVEVEGNNEILASVASTRSLNQPELKQYYEQSENSYSKILSDIEEFPLLSSYYHNCPTLQFTYTDAEKMRLQVVHKHTYRHPALIHPTDDGWFLYCYQQKAEAQGGLMHIKDQLGHQYPDLVQHARVLYAPRYTDTSYRFRLSTEQHQAVQALYGSSKKARSDLGLFRNHANVADDVITYQTTKLSS